MLYEEIYIDLPALLLPSRVLDLLFLKNNAPPEDVIVDTAILAWIPVEDVKKYFQLKCEKIEKEYHNDLERETWRSHNLYKKSVAELQQECKNFKQSTSGQKHELVKKLALASGETERETFQPSYNGKLSSLPKSLSEIKKMSIPTIKYILKSHAMSYVDSKDELVLRLYLMIHKRSNLAFYQEEKQLKHCIEIAKSLVSLEIKQSLLECNEIRRIRKHNTLSVEQSKIKVPSNIQTDY